MWAVPDDFDIWDAPTSSYSRVDVSAVPPGEEPAGHRNVSVGFNVITMKILVVNFISFYKFLVSEVEFFNHTCKLQTAAVVNEDTKSITTTETIELPRSHDQASELRFETRISTKAMATSGVISEVSHILQKKSPISIPEDQSVLANQRETTTAWILFAMMSILFSGSLTINVIVLAFLVYKKRQVGGEKGQCTEFEIEGNPCYEATEMKQSSENEAHVYETVREKRTK